jgi:hypothetical protein
VQGRNGPLTHRKVDVKCVARTGVDGAECGKVFVVVYQQLYNASVYSCGCTPKPKHPPIRLEGQRHGRVEVLRWAGEEAWELICHECGEILYRRNAEQVRRAGESCQGHAAKTAGAATEGEAPFAH